MTYEADEPTGFTGNRDQAPAIDRMADYLELWDTVIDTPRDYGAYLALSAHLLSIAEEGNDPSGSG